MLFPTIDFGLFFCLSLALVWSLNSQNTLKKVVLLGLSLAFYASWNWRFLLLLLASGVISYLVGLYVDSAADRPFRRAVLTLGVVLDLGILAYFKYLDFFIAQGADPRARARGSIRRSLSSTRRCRSRSRS